MKPVNLFFLLSFFLIAQAFALGTTPEQDLAALRSDSLKKLEAKSQQLFKTPLKISLTANFLKKGDALFAYLNEDAVPNLIRRLEKVCTSAEDCQLMGSVFKELIIDADNSLSATKLEVLTEIKALKVTFSSKGRSMYESNDWTQAFNHMVIKGMELALSKEVSKGESLPLLKQWSTKWEQGASADQVLRLFFEMRAKSSENFRNQVDSAIATGLARDPGVVSTMKEKQTLQQLKDWLPSFMRNRKIALTLKHEFLNRTADELDRGKEFKLIKYPSMADLYPLVKLGLPILKEGSDPEFLSGPPIQVNTPPVRNRPTWFFELCEKEPGCVESVMQIYFSNKLSPEENQAMLAALTNNLRDAVKLGLVKSLEAVKGDEKKFRTLVGDIVSCQDNDSKCYIESEDSQKIYAMVYEKFSKSPVSDVPYVAFLSRTNLEGFKSSMSVFKSKKEKLLTPAQLEEFARTYPMALVRFEYDLDEFINWTAFTKVNLPPAVNRILAYKTGDDSVNGDDKTSFLSCLARHLPQPHLEQFKGLIQTWVTSGNVPDFDVKNVLEEVDKRTKK